MTPKERAAMQQALGALEKTGIEGTWLLHDEAITALREALSEQAEQEPVYAFRRKGQDSFCTCDKERYEELSDKPNLFEVATFYAAPVRTKDLTDDEIVELPNFDGVPIGKRQRIGFARAVIAKFKEKNK